MSAVRSVEVHVAEAPEPVRVAWLAPRDASCDVLDARGSARFVDPVDAEAALVGRDECGRLPALRSLLGVRLLVLDARGTASFGRADARAAAHADAILVESESERATLAARHHALAARAAVVPTLLDLEANAPEPVLEARSRVTVQRFRRLHRLAGPVVLFAGPYDERGGLAEVLDTVLALRAGQPDLRLTAVPLGAVSQRYLDRCERRALTLGHHGVIEWTLPEEERPLWFATASVVCLPTASSGTRSAAMLAAAAGRPVVTVAASEAARVVRDGVTGRVLPAGDPPALATALRALVDRPAEADELGRRAREDAEARWSAVAVARALERVWAPS